MFPERYLFLLRQQPTGKASLGYGGIQLHSETELPTAQIGYSVSPGGISLCTGVPGDWRQEWLVIAHTLSSGEPLILDTTADSLPILTDFHGQGVWEPWRIADSAEGFFQAFSLVLELGLGREHPVALSKNPLPTAMRKSTLEAISKSNPHSDITFWEMLLPTDE
ncbi:hypothetical protein [Ideonella paludis]|uniref:SMI1/KNR4 family protein n=1 Tax=Ideonella paludis TaxID=1233411 RepID=A0ABS5E262_9BURK|nr:hypothetical protein [Ideonella paludis]MBQ0937509.1 hypothetical protein [Ideonella paludis]